MSPRNDSSDEDMTPVPAVIKSDEGRMLYREMKLLRECVTESTRVVKTHTGHFERIFIDMGRALSRIDDLERLSQGTPHALVPLIRGETQSSADLAEHVGKQVAAKVEEEQKNPSTPVPDAAKVAAISKDVMAAAIMQLKSEQWDRLEAERKANEEDRRVKDREVAKFKIAALTATVTTTLATIAYLIEHFGQHVVK
jgi:hypothetical protein